MQLATGKKRPLGKRFLHAFRQDISAWVLMLPSLILFIFFVWQPLVNGLILSMFETKGFDPVRFIGLQNFIDVTQESSFQSAVINTFKYTLWSLVLGFPLPILTAVMLNEIKRFKAFFRFTVYFPSIVPGVAAAILWSLIYHPTSGLLNSLLSIFGIDAIPWLQSQNLVIPCIVIMMTWKGFGSTAILYLASLQGVNQELYEAAMIDGAGTFARFRRITLPLLIPSIRINVITNIIGSLSVFDIVMSLTGGGPGYQTETLSIYIMRMCYGSKTGYSTAVAIVMFVIVLVPVLISLRLMKRKD